MISTKPKLHKDMMAVDPLEDTAAFILAMREMLLRAYKPDYIALPYTTKDTIGQMTDNSFRIGNVVLGTKQKNPRLVSFYKPAWNASKQLVIALPILQDFMERWLPDVRVLVEDDGMIYPKRDDSEAIARIQLNGDTLGQTLYYTDERPFSYGRIMQGQLAQQMNHITEDVYRSMR